MSIINFLYVRLWHYQAHLEYDILKLRPSEVCTEYFRPAFHVYTFSIDKSLPVDETKHFKDDFGFV